MSTFKRGVVVWRERQSLMVGQQQAWHARVNGCLLSVIVYNSGTFVRGVVERKRPGDGRVELLARDAWSTADDANVLKARNWCEAQALKVSA